MSSTPVLLVSFLIDAFDRLRRKATLCLTVANILSMSKALSNHVLMPDASQMAHH